MTAENIWWKDEWESMFSTENFGKWLAVHSPFEAKITKREVRSRVDTTWMVRITAKAINTSNSFLCEVLLRTEGVPVTLARDSRQPQAWREEILLGSLEEAESFATKAINHYEVKETASRQQFNEDFLEWTKGIDLSGETGSSQTNSSAESVTPDGKSKTRDRILKALGFFALILLLGAVKMMSSLRDQFIFDLLLVPCWIGFLYQSVRAVMAYLRRAT